MIRLHCRIMYVHSTRIVVEQHIEEKPFEKALSKQKFVFFFSKLYIFRAYHKIEKFLFRNHRMGKMPPKKK